MNLRPGIDTPPPSNFIFIKLNFPFDEQEKCIQVLKEIERVRREAVSPERTHDEKSVVDGWALNLLVAFGLRFYLGPLADRQPEEVVPNFPPGGVFEPRDATRFGIKRRVPIYLRTMNAEGDRLWAGKRLSLTSGKKPSEDEITKAYTQWLSDNESDVILYIEANSHALCVDLRNRIENEIIGRTVWSWPVRLRNHGAQKTVAT